MRRECVKRIIVVFMLVLIATLNSAVVGFTSYANDEASFSESGVSISGFPVVLTNDVKAYSTPSESGDVANTFAGGEAVFITGEDGGFTTIFYKGETLYIKTSDISDNIADADSGSDELAAEFEQKAQNDVTYIDSYLRQQRSQRNALIWKIIIGALVAAIIIISIVIGVKNNKKAENDTDNASDNNEDNKDK